MNQWELFLITVCAAGICGVLADKWKIPLGAMAGSLFAVILCVLCFGEIWIPSWCSLGLQILSGAMIGCKISKENLLDCLKRPLVILFLIVGMLLVNGISGFLLARSSELDLLTALFACAPGGLSDMVMISGDMGANVTYVSLIQVSRVVIITCIFPLIYRLIYEKRLYPVRSPASHDEHRFLYNQPAMEKKQRNLWLAVSLLCAAVGGILFKQMGILAGGILGATTAVTILNLSTHKAQFPPFMNRILQICIGIYVGSEVTREILISMLDLILPIAVVILIMLVSAYLMALAISRFTSLDFMTCLLMCTPGGMQEMALLANEFQCDMASVVVTQTMRVVLVLFLFPSFLSFLVEWLVKYL